MSAEPKWIEQGDALIIHAVLIDEFGGSHGTRDEGQLESALARPRQGFAYGTHDVFELAATYAHGIARGHPFLDGNKRTAFVVARVFLGINGQDLRAPEEEVVVMTVGIATGDSDIATYAAWLRKHSRAEGRLQGLRRKRTRTKPSVRRRKPR